MIVSIGVNCSGYTIPNPVDRNETVSVECFGKTPVRDCSPRDNTVIRLGLRQIRDLLISEGILSFPPSLFFILGLALVYNHLLELFIN